MVNEWPFPSNPGRALMARHEVYINWSSVVDGEGFLDNFWRESNSTEIVIWSMSGHFLNTALMAIPEV